MTVGRWLYALGIMLCIFQAEAFAASEGLALSRDGLFVVAIALVWREHRESGLVDTGWFTLIAAWMSGAMNGTPVTAVMAFVGLAMIVGGYRLRWLPRPEHAA